MSTEELNKPRKVLREAEDFEKDVNNLMSVTSTQAALDELKSTYERVGSLMQRGEVIEKAITTETNERQTNRGDEKLKTAEIKLRDGKAQLNQLKSQIEAKFRIDAAKTGSPVESYFLPQGCTVDQIQSQAKQKAEEASKKFMQNPNFEDFRASISQDYGKSMLRDGFLAIPGNNASKAQADRFAGFAQIAAVGYLIYQGFKLLKEGKWGEAALWAGGLYGAWIWAFGDKSKTMSNYVNDQTNLSGTMPGSHAELPVSQSEGHVRGLFDLFKNFDVLKKHIKKNPEGKFELDFEKLKAEGESSDPTKFEGNFVDGGLQQFYLVVGGIIGKGEQGAFNKDMNEVLTSAGITEVDQLSKEKFNSGIKNTHETYNDKIRNEISAKGYEIANISLLNSLLSENKLADGTPLSTDETTKLGQLERAGAIKKAKNGTEAQIAAIETASRETLKKTIESTDFGTRLAPEKQTVLISKAIALKAEYANKGGFDLAAYGGNLYVEHAGRKVMLRAASTTNMYLNMLNNAFDTTDEEEILRQGIVMDQIIDSYSGKVDMKGKLGTDGIYNGPFEQGQIMGGLNFDGPRWLADRMVAINLEMRKVPKFSDKTGTLAKYLNNIRVIVGGKWTTSEGQNSSMTDHNVAMDTRYYNPAENPEKPSDKIYSLWDSETVIPPALTAGGQGPDVNPGRSNDKANESQAEGLVDQAGEAISNAWGTSVEWITRPENEVRDWLILASLTLAGMGIATRVVGGALVGGASGKEILGKIVVGGAGAGAGLFLGSKLVDMLKGKVDTSTKMTPEQKQMVDEQRRLLENSDKDNAVLGDYYGGVDNVKVLKNKAVGDERSRWIIDYLETRDDPGITLTPWRQGEKELVTLIQSTAKILYESKVAPKDVYSKLGVFQQNTVQKAFDRLDGGRANYTALCEYILKNKADSKVFNSQLEDVLAIDDLTW